MCLHFDQPKRVVGLKKRLCWRNVLFSLYLDVDTPSLFDMYRWFIKNVHNPAAYYSYCERD